MSDGIEVEVLTEIHKRQGYICVISAYESLTFQIAELLETW